MILYRWPFQTSWPPEPVCVTAVFGFCFCLWVEIAVYGLIAQLVFLERTCMRHNKNAAALFEEIKLVLISSLALCCETGYIVADNHTAQFLGYPLVAPFWRLN